MPIRTPVLEPRRVLRSILTWNSNLCLIQPCQGTHTNFKEIQNPTNYSVTLFTPLWCRRYPTNNSVKHFQKWSKIVKYGRKWSNMIKKGQQLTKIDKKCILPPPPTTPPPTTLTRFWPHCGAVLFFTKNLGENCQKVSKMVNHFQKWSNKVKKGKKWTKMVKNGLVVCPVVRPVVDLYFHKSLLHQAPLPWATFNIT